MTPDQIRALRERLRESQAKFAERFSVSIATIASWERGRSQPGGRHLRGITDLDNAAALPKIENAPFRPIQYLGSKLRLAETISEVIDELAPREGRVADLFSGSGVVSAYIGRNRPVTSVDIQEYSSTLAKALLYSSGDDFNKILNSDFSICIAEEAEKLMKKLNYLIDYEVDSLKNAQNGAAQSILDIIEYGSIAANQQRPFDGISSTQRNLLERAADTISKIEREKGDLTATKYYGGPYFSYRQAIELDAIHIASKRFVGYLSDECVKGVLLSTTSEIVNTVGKQFAQPMKLKKADGSIPKILLERTLRDRQFDTIAVYFDWANRWLNKIPNNSYQHNVEKQEVTSFIESDTECCAYYADPPYTIDHYSRFYHVLETIVKRDNPILDEMRKNGNNVVMRGLYRKGRYQSEYCIPSTAHTAFDRLMYAISQKNKPALFSYSPFEEASGNRPRLMPISSLLEIASKYFAKASVLEITEHSHRKLNSKSQNGVIRPDAERLIICEP